jgi:hypothetical protein
VFFQQQGKELALAHACDRCSYPKTVGRFLPDTNLEFLAPAVYRLWYFLDCLECHKL